MDSDRAQPKAGYGQPGGAPRGPAALEQDFDAGSLYALRSAVAAHAAAGVSPGRVYDVVIAVHELAANAVRHGAGHGCLRLQADGTALSCQVTDAGPAPAGENTKPLAVTTPWPAEHGHGLWLIGQVADQFTIDHGPVGTTAAVTLTSPQ